MKIFFEDPKVAANPIVYLTGTNAVANGSYHHIWKEKAPRADALDPKKTSNLWDQANKILLANKVDPSYLM